MSDPVIASIEGATGIIDLARPEKFNCLSLDVHERIAAARAEFEANPDIRAILIRAQGKHFCTGADLNEVKGKLNDPAALDHFIAFGMKNLRALETSSLPVVVAVQGLCLAGGIELMLACDVCFAFVLHIQNQSAYPLHLFASQILQSAALVAVVFFSHMHSTTI
mgnify:CR=1 FL=1